MVKLQPPRLKPAEYERVIYVATPEFGTTVEDMMKPEYWANVGHQFKPGSRIEATSEDSTWFAEFVVIASARLWAKVALLRFVELTEVSQDELPSGGAEEDFEVKWAGNSAKFRIIRKLDKGVVKDGFQTKIDAENWLRDYVKAMA